MFFIVWYHLLSFYIYVYPHNSINDFLVEAIIPSLHVGVILFVLISGFYGIKPSFRGFAKLLVITMVYFLPLQFIQLYMEGRLSHPRAILNSLMFITNTPYWFIRTYLYLYLCAPLVNTFIKSSSQKRTNILLLILGIISVYFGTTQGDPSLIDGKNLVNFLFLYLLGYTIKIYQKQIQRINIPYYLVAYIVLNIFIIFALLLFKRGTIIGDGIWQLIFPYCSPILILNATLLFVVFSRITLNSKFVNVVASSMFAVYLLHCHPAIMQVYMPEVCEWINTPSVGLFVYSMAVSILLMVVSVLVDKALIPLWNLRDTIIVRIQERFNVDE